MDTADDVPYEYLDAGHHEAPSGLQKETVETSSPEIEVVATRLRPDAYRCLSHNRRAALIMSQDHAANDHVMVFGGVSVPRSMLYERLTTLFSPAIAVEPRADRWQPVPLDLDAVSDGGGGDVGIAAGAGRQVFVGIGVDLADHRGV